MSKMEAAARASPSLPSVTETQPRSELPRETECFVNVSTLLRLLDPSP